MKIKKHKLLLSTGLFMLSLATFAVIGKGSALAADRTWTGGGADNKFSTVENWDNNAALADGDKLIFDRSVVLESCDNEAASVTLDNDLENLVFSGISVDGDAPSGCATYITISNKKLKLSGDLIVEYANSTYFELSTELEATQNLTIESVRGQLLKINDNKVRLGGYDTSFTGVNGSSDSELTIATNHQIYVNEDATSSSPITGASDFTGKLIVDAYSYVYVSTRDDDIARKASSILVKKNGAIVFQSPKSKDVSFGVPIKVEGGNLQFARYIEWNEESQKSIYPESNTIYKLTGDVELTDTTRVDASYVSVHFTGKVTGEDNIDFPNGQTGSYKIGDKEEVTSKVKTFTIDELNGCHNLYFATVKNNKVVISVNCTKAADDYNKYKDPENPLKIAGILAGTGQTGHVKIEKGGIIAPGNSPGTLTVGNIEWVEGGIYEFEIGKDAHDQIKALGAVKLGNGTLDIKILEGAAPKAGDSYVIIDNDGTDAVEGTFAGLPEGGTINVGGVVYQITYKGGDGNDVVLSVKDVPKAPNTGFNMLKNNPIATLAATTASAAMILAVAKKRGFKIFSKI